MQVIIFGTGSYYERCRENLTQVQGLEIAAFVDNNQEKWGKLVDGKKVIAPAELAGFPYDRIIIASYAYEEITAQLIGLGIAVDKINIASLSTGLQFCTYSIEPDPGKNALKYTVSREHSETVRFACAQGSKTDTDIVHEFYAGIYNYNFPKAKSVVIDIGMNIGVPTIHFAANPNVDIVYSYEPFAGTYAQALDNIAMNTPAVSGKIHAFNYGLLDYDGTAECAYLSEATGWGSLVGNETWGLKTQKTQVTVRDAGTELERIMKAHPQQPVILKIDCEGSEHKIFETVKKHALFPHVDFIMMEWHYSYKNLQEILQKERFHVLVTFSGTQPVATGMLYAVRQDTERG